MALTISVGSGKGGTGKSMVLANLAILLAKQGKKTCVIDLDIGGANAHIFFGLFNPESTLTDFLSHRVNTLAEITHTLDAFYGLQLIAGTGETLQSANMSYKEKSRILRAIDSIEADVVLIDVGAGANYHSLDFFMAADLQICTTMPEPTSVMDLYRFVQLATLRKALSGFLSHSEVALHLKNRQFQTIGEVFALAEQVQPGARETIQKELRGFHPLLVVNRVSQGSRLNTMKLKKIVSQYLGIYLPDLGEIPSDRKVEEALLAYMPICEYAPSSPAAQALVQIADKLLMVVDLFNRSAARKAQRQGV